MKLDYVICTRYFHRWSLDSKTFRSLRDLPMYIRKSLCRDLFNVDVIVCDCLTSWAFRCMKINWLLFVVVSGYSNVVLGQYSSNAEKRIREQRMNFQVFLAKNIISWRKYGILDNLVPYLADVGPIPCRYMITRRTDAVLC